MNIKNNIEQIIIKKDIVKNNYYSLFGKIILLIIIIGLSVDKYFKLIY